MKFDSEERHDPNGDSMSLREQINEGVPHFSTRIINGRYVIYDNWLGEFIEEIDNNVGLNN